MWMRRERFRGCFDRFNFTSLYCKYTMKILDGKKIAGEIKEELKKDVLVLKEKGIVPSLSVILVGGDEASKIYIRNKVKACEELGIVSKVYSLAEDTREKELFSLINKLNDDSSVHGLLVQSPVPKHIDERKVIEVVSPKKDVDCFHPENVGRMVAGRPKFLPCTPAGIIELLKRNDIEIAGREAVVVGRSNIVGKPLANMLINESATVTICHSKTRDLRNICRRADILIAAVGKAGLITSDMVNKDVTVIDVGMNRNEEGKLVGDVDFENVSKFSFAITPVPGGVGPMTVAMLMQNTVRAAKNL